MLRRAGAGDNLAALVDKILTQCPDAALLVAKLVASSDGATQSRIDSFNAAVESIVSSRIDAGKHIQLMHMDAAITGIVPCGRYPPKRQRILPNGLSLAGRSKVRRQPGVDPGSRSG